MKLLALGAFVGLVLGGGLLVVGSGTGLIKLPAPETCFLGYPNSGNTTVVQVSGKGAWDVCDDITNPIRQTNTLKNMTAVAGNSWAPIRLRQFDRFGLSWTMYSSQATSANAPSPCDSLF
jgi:hypothetical protein